MHEKSIAELEAGLASREFSSEELTRGFLARIEQLDPDLNAFITVTPELAIARARAADRRLAAGEAAPLTGIPIAHKDIFCTQGVKTTCGSKMLDTFISPYNATVVESAERAGMVTLGKTNMDEFAMGSSNENSYYGAVRNPWDRDRVPGGSSGGSAAAVAAGLAPIATGTDTGGSVRQPAALCGLTGLKPTYGRVSRFGMVAFASSLDQCGIIARRAEDAARLLGVIAGFDEKDSTSIDRPVDDYVAGVRDAHRRKPRIGVVEEYLGDGLDERVARVVRSAIDEFEALGCELEEVSLPTAGLSVPTYYVVASAECSSNLARFDGVRYGHRAAAPESLEDLYERSRAEGFGPEVTRRILIGTYTLSAGYYDAYYLKAQRLRQLIAADFQRAFESVDLVVGPTSPTPAFRLGEKTDDPVTMYLNDIFTTAANLAGLPAISIPAGFVSGLPVGVQLIGNYFDEAGLLGAAHAYQQATDWHLRVPPSYT